MAHLHWFVIVWAHLTGKVWAHPTHLTGKVWAHLTGKVWVTDWKGLGSSGMVCYCHNCGNGVKTNSFAHLTGKFFAHLTGKVSANLTGRILLGLDWIGVR